MRLEPVGASTIIDWASADMSVASIDHGLITWYQSDKSVMLSAATSNELEVQSPAVDKITAGVDGIEVDGSEAAPVEYYNLNGIRVNGDSFAPGIYIKRQGRKTTKILVR